MSDNASDIPSTAVCRAVLAILTAAQIVVALDFSLVSVALPSIERGLNIPSSASQWVLTATILAYGCFLIVGGRIVDTYGQRRALTGGVSLFLIGSTLSAFAPNLAILLLARLAQGFGAAMTYPATMSLLAQHFPAGPPRFRALTIATGSQIVALPMGTIFAGWMVGRFGWNATFIFNVPICVAILLAIPRALSSLGVPSRNTTPIPFLSSLVLAIAMGLLIQAALGVVARDEMTRQLSLYAFPLGLFAMAIFVYMQYASSSPLIAMSVLRVRNLAICIFVTSLLVLAGKSIVLMSNISFQQGLHFTPFQASLALLPYMVSGLLMIPISARLGGYLLPRVRSTLVIAFLMFATLHFILSVTPGSVAATVLVLVLIVQPCVSLVAVNLGIGETVKDVALKDQGIAVGMLFSTVQVVGGVGMSLMIAATDRSPSIIDDFTRFSSSFRIGVVACLFGALFTWLAFRQTSGSADTKPSPA